MVTCVRFSSVKKTGAIILVSATLAGVSSTASGAPTQNPEQVVREEIIESSASSDDKRYSLSIMELTPEEVVELYPEQVKPLAETYKIDLLDAARGLQMQEPAGGVWAALRSSQDRFAGAWMEWQPSPHLKVAFATTVDAAARGAALDLAVDSGVSVETTTATWTYEELTAAAEELASSLSMAGAKLDEVLVSIDEEMNDLVVSGAAAEQARPRR